MKPKTLIRNTLILAIWLMHTALAIPSVSGEETAGEPGGNYIFQVLYLKGPIHEEGVKDLGAELKYVTDGEVIALHAPQRSMTRPVIYRGPSQLVFFNEEANAVGELIRKPIASAALGASGMKVIVMGRNSAGRLVTSVMDTSASSLKPDSVRVVNFSKQLIKLKLEDAITSISSMDTQDFPVKAGKRNSLFRLAVAASDGNEPYLVVDEKMSMKRDGRELVVIHHDPYNPDKVIHSPFSLANKTDITNYSDEGALVERTYGKFLSRYNTE